MAALPPEATAQSPQARYSRMCADTGPFSFTPMWKVPWCVTLNISHPLLSSPYFPSCPGHRLVFLLGCVTIPGGVCGVFCWQRLAPPIACMDRLAYPRAHLNREAHPQAHQDTRKPGPGQREKTGVSLWGPRGLELWEKRSQSPRRGLSCRFGKWGHS